MVAPDQSAHSASTTADRLQLLEEVAQEFEDDLSARALFATRAPSRAYANEGPIDARVERIAQEIQALDALQHSSDPALRNRVISEIREGRSAVLFIFVQLRRLDPTKILRRWLDRAGGASADLGAMPILEPSIDAATIDFIEQIVVEVATTFGLWDQRGAARNLAAAYRDRAKVERVARQLAAWRRAEDGDPTQPRVEIVRHALIRRAARSLVEVRWDWRHIAAILDCGPHELWHSGFVTVVAKSAQEAYRMLGELHKEFPHEEESVRDYLSAPVRVAYSALHTIVRLPSRTGRPAYTRVRVVARSHDPMATPRPKGVGLDSITGWLRNSSEQKITALTPDSLKVALRTGATVLEFALAVHERFVGYVDHAIINGSQRIELLDEVLHCDIVELRTTDHPNPLPLGWSEVVPPRIASRIRSALRENSRELLESMGQRWIERKLVLRGFRGSLVPDELRKLVAVALKPHRLRAFAPNSEKLARRGQTADEALGDWWLVQLGLFAAFSGGDDRWLSVFGGRHSSPSGRTQPLLSSSAAEDAVEAIARELGLVPELWLSREVGPIIRQRMCSACKPTALRPLVAQFDHASGTLTVHRPRALCARDSFEVRLARASEEAQYFVLQTSSRRGVLNEALQFFHDENVALSAVEARRNSPVPGQDLIRIEVEPLSRLVAARLRKRLQEVGGAYRLLGPEDSPNPFIERDLSPRRQSKKPATARPKWLAGPAIDDDEYFYGRDFELSQLSESVRGPLRGARGRTIFVRGPYRIGKSSLIECFLRKVRRLAPEAQPFTAAFVATESSTWDQAFFTLAEKLTLQMRDYGDFAEGTPIEQLLSQISRICRRPIVVLVFDEIAKSLRNNKNRSAIDCDRLQQLARNTPTLILFSGPLQPIVDLPLDDPWRRLLLSESTPIDVGCFSATESRELLEGRKDTGSPPLHLGMELGSRIHRDTGGDPSVLAALANKVFDRLRSRASSEYEPDDVRFAEDQLLYEGTPFAAKFQDLVGPRRDLLSFLGQTWPDGAEAPSPLTFEEIQLESEIINLDRRDLKALVEAGGACEIADNKPRYHIAYPLLARFLCQTYPWRESP